jgi:beta-galactosidase
MYRGLRKLGFSVDILPPDSATLDGYKLVLIPGLITLPEALKNAVAHTDAQVILGPRTNAKTENLSIPVPLPPALPGLDATVAYVETLRADMPRAVQDGGAVKLWREQIETTETVLDADETGAPVMIRKHAMHYLAAWPDPEYLNRVLIRAARDAGLTPRMLRDGIRIRQCGKTRFVFNHEAHDVLFEGQTIPPAGVIWDTEAG